MMEVCAFRVCLPGSGSVPLTARISPDWAGSVFNWPGADNLCKLLWAYMQGMHDVVLPGT